MRQNAPNPISISFFSGGNTPGPPPLGAPDPRGGERREEKGQGEGEGRGRRGREGEGKFASLPLGGIDAPAHGVTGSSMEIVEIISHFQKYD